MRGSRWRRTGCARVGIVDGLVFGTLADDAEPLEDYLDPPIRRERRLFNQPVQVLGYNRQHIRGNWKLYAQNTRDNYHASLLHEFLMTFGLDQSTQKGGVAMDGRQRRDITCAEADSDSEEFARAAYTEARVRTNLAIEAPFAVYQTDREGETRLFATGLYRDRLEPVGLPSNRRLPLTPQSLARRAGHSQAARAGERLTNCLHRSSSAHWDLPSRA
jgi:phenylpropionate dioxygenase-like ring-hydroxylating dioxygenase large terminal subunit